jgi:hypothetical protein
MLMAQTDARARVSRTVCVLDMGTPNASALDRLAEGILDGNDRPVRLLKIGVAAGMHSASNGLSAEALLVRTHFPRAGSDSEESGATVARCFPEVVSNTLISLRLDVGSRLTASRFTNRTAG